MGYGVCLCCTIISVCAVKYFLLLLVSVEIMLVPSFLALLAADDARSDCTLCCYVLVLRFLLLYRYFVFILFFLPLSYCKRVYLRSVADPSSFGVLESLTVRGRE